MRLFLPPALLAIAACTLALVLAPSAMAAPKVIDLPSTSVDIAVPDPNDPLPAVGADTKSHVTVTVSRVDELVEDTTGDLLAARIVDIGFTFDLPPASSQPKLLDGDISSPVLMVNSVPVKLGLSRLEVATTVVASATIADVLPPELLSLAFDVGLAVVDVQATEEHMVLARSDLVADYPAPAADSLDASVPDEIEVRRVTVTVHVSEINGIKVEQIDLVEQVIDILAEGYILRAAPTTRPCTADPEQMAAMQARQQAHRQHCIDMQHGRHRVAALWARLPHGTRVAVAAFFGSLLILVLFVALPLAAYVHLKERRAGYHLVGSDKAMAMASSRLPTIQEEEEDEERPLPAVPERSVDEKAWLRANDTYQQ